MPDIHLNLQHRNIELRFSRIDFSSGTVRLSFQRDLKQPNNFIFELREFVKWYLNFNLMAHCATCNFSKTYNRAFSLCANMVIMQIGLKVYADNAKSKPAGYVPTKN